MAGVQGDSVAIERQVGLDLGPDIPAQDPGAHQGEPARDRGDIGPGVVSQIALRPCRQIGLGFSHPSGPANIAAEVADVECNLPPLADRLSCRAGQPHRVPVARCKGAVAGQWQPADLPQGIGFKVGHPVTQTERNALQGLGGHVVGKLKPGNFGGGDGAAQAVAGVHEQVGGIAHKADQRVTPQVFHDEMRQLDCPGRVIHFGRTIIFPADRADHRLRPGIGAVQGLCQHVINPGAPTRLRNQRQAGAQDPPDRTGLHKRRDGGIAEAFIAHGQGCVIRPDDQQGLFETRIKAGGPEHIGAMLPVGIDHKMGVLVGSHGGPDPRQPGVHLGQGQRRWQGRRAKIGPGDAGEVRHGIILWVGRGDPSKPVQTCHPATVRWVLTHPSLPIASQPLIY